MTIYENGLDAIRIGVEDSKSEDEARLHSATRNLVAGIYLLYKEKLRRLSPAHDPEALIKSRIVPCMLPDGSVSIKGIGKKTVDHREILERFKELSIQIDSQRLEKLKNLRNDIEHYYTQQTTSQMQEVLATSFILIRDFMSVHLQDEPLNELGEDCWQQLLTAADVYSAEELMCKSSFENIDWKYDIVSQCHHLLRCTSCNSALVRTEDSKYSPDMWLLCKSCGNEFRIGDAIESCVLAFLNFDWYTAGKEGIEPPYATCPSCDRDSFFYSEGICIACEDSLDYANCVRCDESLSVDEQFLDGYCGYCSHMMSKYMND